MPDGGRTADNKNDRRDAPQSCGSHFSRRLFSWGLSLLMTLCWFGCPRRSTATRNTQFLATARAGNRSIGLSLTPNSNPRTAFGAADSEGFGVRHLFLSEQLPLARITSGQFLTNRTLLRRLLSRSIGRTMTHSLNFISPRSHIGRPISPSLCLRRIWHSRVLFFGRTFDKLSRIQPYNYAYGRERFQPIKGSNGGHSHSCPKNT